MINSNGQWRIHFKGYVKTCSNYLTALAWAKYFFRQGYYWSIDGIYLSKVDQVVKR